MHKKQIKEFIPPVLIKLIRMARAKPVTWYSNYETALMHCGTGYDASEIAEVVVEKLLRQRDLIRKSEIHATPDNRTGSLAIACGLSIFGDRLNCLDFGGAAGGHFFIARELLGRTTNLCWHVVETKSMVAAASKLACDGLRFFTDIEEAAAAFKTAGKEIDLVFTSGTLPHIPAPEETLKQLVDLNARRIFITRTGLTEERMNPRVSIHHSRLSLNGHGPLPSGFKDRALAYPVTFCCKPDIERIIASRYSIDLTIREEASGYLSGKVPIDMFGIFGRKKTTL